MSLIQVTLLLFSTEVSRRFSLQTCHVPSEAESQIKVNIKIQLKQAAWSQAERGCFKEQ